jgi:predicted RecB family nuclease
MLITSHLFDAYLKCPTKCYLRSLGETATGNLYADWVRARQTSCRAEGIKSLIEAAKPDECATDPIDTENIKSAKWLLATDKVAKVHGLQSTLDAVAREPSAARDQPAQFVPIRFSFTNKVSRDDRLLLVFDALVLSEMLGRDVASGKIIHGAERATAKMQTGALANEVRNIIADISKLLSGEEPPDLILNRHCPECEFQNRCKQKAIEKDDLSLLAGITEIERSRYRSKGIFTVMQLSYTFRPRRTPKRAKNPGKPRYNALQALAIRESTVYIHGTPQLSASKAQVYLDIEGLPDSDSYYLIGVLIVFGGQETFHSFWADQASQEPEIFARLVETVSELHDFRVLHFGGYETVALKRMRASLPECLHPKLDRILERATNVLSVIHPHVYFPTYSNSLKEIGRFLGFARDDETVTGLQSIVWRKTWNDNEAPEIKARLLQYNQDDCRALKLVCDFIGGLNAPDTAAAAMAQACFKTARTEELTKDRPRWELFRPREEYATEDLKKVAKCAYFDYQREKVFVRTDPHFKVINKKHRRYNRTSFRINKVYSIESQRCPRCNSRNIQKGRQISHDLVDLKFFKSGVKKWITRTVSWKYSCSKCKHAFSSAEPLDRHKFGHGLLSWCVYSNVGCGLNMGRVERSLEDVFGLTFNQSQFFRSKRYIMALYQPLCEEILESILASQVIHIDETTVRLQKQTGYVWVMTTLDRVYYFYKSSREGSFLQQMLDKFSGVLVSDFYSGYDSLKCEQQKCLVHFVRDIDDDILKNPLDMELKKIAQEFGLLLRTIIETVDTRGLKSRYLRKHKPSVVRFLESVGSANFTSELANKYKKRFQKSGKKMFTFLDHDGVPWNNNNAEHAIKRFAKYRRDADGRFTERSLQEYLVLATVFETCEFNNLNVLRFLLSKETRLTGLLRMAGR